MVIGTALGAMAPAAAAADGLSLGATGEIIYDSNQLRGRVAGRHPDDFRYSPAGNFQYTRALGRGTLDLHGVAGYDFFQYNRNLNRNRFGAGGALSSRVGARCSASITGNYTQRQNGITSGSLASIPDGPLAVDDLPPDDIGQLIDNRQILVVYSASANCGSPGGRLTFGGGATRSSIENGAPSRQFANSNSQNYNVFAGLGVFRPGQLQVNGSYSTISYPNNLIVPGVPVSPFRLRTGVKTYSAGLSYSRPFGNKLSGSIGVSYLTSRPDGGQSPFSAPAYNIGLTYRPGNRLSFSANGSRSVLSSTTAGALFRVVDSIQLATTYKIGRSLSANAHAGFTSNNYKQSFDIPGQPARGSDSSRIYGVGLNYAPRPLYDINLGVTQTTRTSNPNIYDYSSTRASLTLSVHV